MVIFTSISVVIPVYNEGGCIKPNLEKVIKYLASRFSRFQVIVVDDGSTDDTHERLKEVVCEGSRIRVISFQSNHGKGFAVRQGILKAEGEVVFFTDADLSTPMEETEKALVELSKGYPVVIASRQHRDSTIRVRQSFHREVMGKCFNLLVKLLFRLPFRDTQCGFKCFSQRAAREIFSVAQIDGFAFDVEILLVARRLGHSVREIPICWTNSPESKVRLIQGSLGMLRELAVIYRNDWKGLHDRKAMKG